MRPASGWNKHSNPGWIFSNRNKAKSVLQNFVVSVGQHRTAVEIERSFSCHTFVCVHMLKCWNGKRQIHYFGSTMILEHLDCSILSFARSYFLHSFHAYLFYFFSRNTFLFVFQEKRVCMYANIQIFALEFLLSIFFWFVSTLKRALSCSYQVLLMFEHMQYVCIRLLQKKFAFNCSNLDVVILIFWTRVGTRKLWVAYVHHTLFEQQWC